MDEMYDKTLNGLNSTGNLEIDIGLYENESGEEALKDSEYIFRFQR